MLKGVYMCVCVCVWMGGGGGGGRNSFLLESKDFFLTSQGWNFSEEGYTRARVLSAQHNHTKSICSNITYSQHMIRTYDCGHTHPYKFQLS